MPTYNRFESLTGYDTNSMTDFPVLPNSMTVPPSPLLLTIHPTPVLPNSMTVPPPLLFSYPSCLYPGAPLLVGRLKAKYEQNRSDYDTSVKIGTIVL